MIRLIEFQSETFDALARFFRSSTLPLKAAFGTKIVNFENQLKVVQMKEITERRLFREEEH